MALCTCNEMRLLYDTGAIKWHGSYDGWTITFGISKSYERTMKISLPTKFNYCLFCGNKMGDPIDLFEIDAWFKDLNEC